MVGTALYDDEKLYQTIKDLAVVGQKELDEAREAAKSSGKSLGEVLIERDVVSDENLGKIISDLISVPFVRLAQESISPTILNIIPEVVAKKQKIICFGKDDKGIKLAMVDPDKREIVDFVAKKTGEKVTVYLATDRDVESTLVLYKKDLQKSFDELLKDKVDEAGKIKNNDAPVSQMVNLLVEYAYGNRASDVHIEPEKEESLVRFRIDGVLRDVLHLPKSLHEQVVSRVKVASKLKTDEHLSAQDGKMQVSLPEEDLDIRVSVVPITKGEKVVMRLLSSKSRQFNLADLGMSEGDLSKVREGFNKPFGMVLSTGPTGCGKTTTIYAILKILNTRDVNIATIEDPVEYDIARINQIQVNQKTNLTFANGLRSILRQDPNIIFVGEIRDPETADIAVNSATTGHLVLSTLHTNDAATTLPRLMDMGVEPYLIATTVNVIIGQRLVRRICEKCRFSVSIKAADLSKQIPTKIIKRQLGEKTEFRAYQGKGCPVCHNTGYSGRIGIFEVLVVGQEMRDLILAKVSSDQITEKAVSLGMSTMLEDGLVKVQEGVTTVEEVLRATTE